MCVCVCTLLLLTCDILIAIAIVIVTTTIEFNQLTGTIPKELAQSLTSLESLHLEGNWLLTNNENLEPLCSKQHGSGGSGGSGGNKRREIVVNCEKDIPCSCCTCYDGGKRRVVV
jgi:hypothetical protein